MIPRTLSATSLTVANQCMARWKAEYYDRAARASAGTAATLGTTVHAALETYVRLVYMDKSQEPSAALLIEMYRMAWTVNFGMIDEDNQDFIDGLDMLNNWYMRTTPYLNQDNVMVLTCEVKDNFEIKTSGGVIPFTFIFDRSDDLGNGEYKVVDYKSQRVPFLVTDLKKKVQVRAYGLAMQILYPDAREIWVELDFLRGQGPVGVKITRQDNVDAWKYFKMRAEQIVQTDESAVTETLNPECKWCVRKANCPTLNGHISVGGIIGRPVSELVDMRASIEWQVQGLVSTMAEIDDAIMTEAKETEVLRWESEDNILEIGTTRGTRTVDPDMAAKALGEEIMNQYGGRKLTMSAVDKILKDRSVPEEKKRALKSLIYTTSGNPKVFVKSKSPLGDDD